jgi:hypothetical protein
MFFVLVEAVVVLIAAPVRVIRAVLEVMVEVDMVQVRVAPIQTEKQGRYTRVVEAVEQLVAAQVAQVDQV